MLRSLSAGIVLAFAGSRANVARTILSCAGIVIGVGALIMVVTAGDLGQRYATAFSEANAGRAATMETATFGSISDLDAYEEDLSRSGAQDVSLYQSPQDNLILRSGDEVLDLVNITAVDVALGDIRRINLTEGRWFTEADLESRAPVLVVNEALSDAIGDRTALQMGTDRWIDVRVVGVSEDSILDGGWFSAYLLRSPASEDMIFGPGWDAEAGGFAAGTQDLLTIHLARLDPSDSAAEHLTGGAEFADRMNSAQWRWSGGAEVDFMAARTDYSNETDFLISIMSWGLIGVAAITLSTGMLGVLNVGLVTVRERRRELATYRALGASRFTLFVAVVMEAVVVSVIAGIIALVLSFAVVALAGVAIGNVLTLPPDITMTVPPAAVLVGLASAALVGLLAGIIPAIRALRASVVAGLRE
ncbi:ABC transporter permease [Nocardiopsis sp. MG754419]|uniref:ABC transporter permease n=1 Tax=Nocardiopsis sp. MG754419 TaxID=2259865 RepID=UPI001BA71145|nr:ABC transporter permease [Nocardiopsis sp. MG754419]MBR8741354.1 ABC transporter permease [Nocardiopsis sp. MG754419]